MRSRNESLSRRPLGRSVSVNESTIRLSLGELTFDFVPAALVFRERQSADLFARKNNKTLGQAIQHPKYAHLAPKVLANYRTSLDLALGDFLLGLKKAGDAFYHRFLNRHGDLLNCEFRLADLAAQRLKGLYCFSVDSALKYIGRSTDSSDKRINQGYGRIHPKNCYRDGQSANCHLNALIAGAAAKVRLHIHPLGEDGAINAAESSLIVKYNPRWNIQLRSG